MFFFKRGAGTDKYNLIWYIRNCVVSVFNSESSIFRNTERFSFKEKSLQLSWNKLKAIEAEPEKKDEVGKVSTQSVNLFWSRVTVTCRKCYHYTLLSHDNRTKSLDRKCSE